jgi:hypothetical protein
VSGHLLLIYGDPKGANLEEIEILFGGNDSHVGNTLPVPGKKINASTVEHVQEVWIE